MGSMYRRDRQHQHRGIVLVPEPLFVQSPLLAKFEPQRDLVVHGQLGGPGGEGLEAREVLREEVGGEAIGGRPHHFAGVGNMAGRITFDIGAINSIRGEDPHPDPLGVDLLSGLFSLAEPWRQMASAPAAGGRGRGDITAGAEVARAIEGGAVESSKHDR